MKRLWAVAIVALLTLPAAAQIRGVPASVTSQTQWRTTSGIPASVTSLGPNGYGNTRDFGRGFHNYNSMCSTPGALIPSAMGCTNPVFTNQMYGLPRNAPPTNLRDHGRRGGHGGYYYPVYIPYTVPVVVEPETDSEAAPPAESYEPPAMTVFERRPTTAVKPVSAPPIDESRVYHPGMEQPAEQQPEAPQPPIVLIYKDGHQREVQNYAIVGRYVYDISGYSSQKIPLADLNLPATIKANDERGIEFSVPAGVNP